MKANQLLVAGAALVGAFAVARLAMGEPPVPEPGEIPLFSGGGGLSPEDPAYWDRNGNGVIDDEEFLAAMAAFDRGELSQEAIFRITDLWVAQKPVQ